MEISGKTALVTGAARRLGRELCRGLSREGATVAVHYHTSDAEADALVRTIEKEGGRAAAFAEDLCDPAASPRLIERVAEALGPVQVLINNASRFVPTSVDTADHAAWQADWMVHAEAPALLAQELHRRLPAGAQGRIVNLVDWRARIPDPRYATYCVTKSALVALTRYLAVALAPRVTVNAIAPGAILPPPEQSNEGWLRVGDGVPLGRIGKPEEIVQAMLYLIRDADYTTGGVIPVDGGRHLL